MKFLPFEHLVYTTQLSKAEVREILLDNIEPIKKIRMKGLFKIRGHKPYEGKIDENTFFMRRIIQYKNGFLPQINGEIHKNHQKATTIHINMKPHKVVLIFSGILCGFVGVIFLIFLGVSLFTLSFDVMVLIPLGMVLFIYMLIMGGFTYESHIAKKHFTKIFKIDNQSSF